MEQKTIFLDFDGVLHSEKDEYNQNFFSHKFHLINLIRTIQQHGFQAKIVVTSTWRNLHTLDYIVKELDLPKDLHIVWDKTETIKAFTGSIEKQKSYQYTDRYQEIINYIKKYKLEENEFVIFDDNLNCFFKTFSVQQIKKIDDLYLENQKVLKDKWKDNSEIQFFDNHFVHTPQCLSDSKIEQAYKILFIS